MDETDRQALGLVLGRWLAALALAVVYFLPLAFILGLAGGIAVWAYRLVAP
jgi:hypothetical protein